MKVYFFEKMCQCQMLVRYAEFLVIIFLASKLELVSCKSVKLRHAGCEDLASANQRCRNVEDTLSTMDLEAKGGYVGKSGNKPDWPGILTLKSTSRSTDLVKKYGSRSAKPDDEDIDAFSQDFFGLKLSKADIKLWQMNNKKDHHKISRKFHYAKEKKKSTSGNSSNGLNIPRENKQDYFEEIEDFNYNLSSTEETERAPSSNTQNLFSNRRKALYNSNYHLTQQSSSVKTDSPQPKNNSFLNDAFQRKKKQDENLHSAAGGPANGKKSTELPQKDQGRRIYSTPTTSRLELISGLYHGLKLSVSEKIPTDQCRVVVEGLKVALQSLSFAMYRATDGMAGLGSVTIELPRHWYSGTCVPPSPATEDEPPMTTEDPQIVVEPPHAVFGDTPWTQKSGGCGKPGDFIQMGVGFLKSVNLTSGSKDRVGRILLAEWAKFRWGVFSETGYQADHLYPLWYSGSPPSWEPNVCSDVAADARPQSCPPHLGAGCPWPHSAMVNATSSLLSIPQLPLVSRFCTPATHNAEAPNKQNALCHGLSAWEVIRDSKDFRSVRIPRGPPAKPPPNPHLFFTQSPPLRFVVLVEDTEIMNIQRRWDFVRKSVRRAIVYDLPDEAQAGVIVFNAKSNRAAPLSTLDSQTDLRERVGSSLPRNPSSVRTSQACIACALHSASKLLKDGRARTRGATVILITSGDQTRESEKEDVMKVVSDEGFRLVLVLYPLVERPGMPIPAHALVSVARQSGGSVFTVMDEGVGTDSKVNMLVSLMEALRSAVRAGGAKTPILVHSATYPGGIVPYSVGSFALDSSLASHARFAVYYYDLNHVGNVIHLTAPSGTTFASVNMQEEDGDVNMIFVNLHNAEKGVWRYQIENRADSHQGLHIQVTAQPNPDNDVTIKVWTSQDQEESFNEEDSSPIIIYGEVKMNGVSVLNAGVMATLQRLGSNATGSSYPPVNVQLLDLGTGDPDITRGDGIYSRYAPPLDGPSRYSLTLAVDATKALLAYSHQASHLLSPSSSAFEQFSQPMYTSEKEDSSREPLTSDFSTHETSPLSSSMDSYSVANRRRKKHAFFDSDGSKQSLRILLDNVNGNDLDEADSSVSSSRDSQQSYSLSRMPERSRKLLSSEEFDYRGNKERESKTPRKERRNSRIENSNPSAAAWFSNSFARHEDHPSMMDLDKDWDMSAPPCCGSVVPYTHTRQVPPFTRYVTGPTIQVWTRWDKEIDSVSPGRITDLTAWVNTSTNNVLLEWTAVGNDRDWGRANSYFAVVTSSKSQAANSCVGKKILGLSTPSPAGSRERVVVDIPVDEKKTLYVCVKASDQAGNSGPPSNAAPIWLPRPPALDGVTLRNQGYGYSSSLDGGSATSEGIAIICGSIGGVLVIVLLIALYCFVYPRRKSNRNKEINNLSSSDENKNTNGEVGLGNGGSVVVTSASRGSVLLNGSQEKINMDKGLFSRNLNTNEMENNQENYPNDRVAMGKYENYPQALEPHLRMIGPQEDDVNKIFSMSIPDVTRVDSQLPTSAITPKDNQFMTLRAQKAVNSSNSSLENSRLSFHELSQNSFRKEMNMAGQKSAQMTSNGSPNSFYHMYQTSDQHSSGEGRTLYRDGSIGGDSLSEGILCDDRTASPPPPAPSGPSDRSNGAQFAPFKHQSRELM